MKKKKRKAAEVKLQAFCNRTHGKKNGHDWVDLGLPSGIKWSTCNVGASRPEEYGYYFAWGETEPAPNNNYSSSNSSTYGHSYSTLQSQYIDGEGNLTAQYDAAKANWGGSWRLPTEAEIEELKKNCTCIWTTQGGKKGYKVTGPNGNSIFLPAAGYRLDTKLYSTGAYGSYWSSMSYESDTGKAYYLYFLCSGSQGVDWMPRRHGPSVRPVSE